MEGIEVESGAGRVSRERVRWPKVVSYRQDSTEAGSHKPETTGARRSKLQQLRLHSRKVSRRRCRRGWRGCDSRGAARVGQGGNKSIIASFRPLRIDDWILRAKHDSPRGSTPSSWADA